MKRKIILDCDPGMDDSMAIVLAAKAAALELLAVTTVCGNYPQEVTCVNARKMLELLGRTDIPVAAGAAQPLVRRAPADPFTHGADGQAENFLPAPAMALSPHGAADEIIRLARQHPHEVTVLCTGPMTNLAAAIQKEPALTELLSGVIAISGAFGFNEASFANATGDTPQSEWNVYVDPEAADIVYRSGIPLTALGLDVATCLSSDFTQEELTALEESPRPEARFLRQAIRYVNGRGYASYCTVIDCMVVAYALDPTLVRTRLCRVGIETKDGLTLGMTVRDGRHHHVWEHLPLVQVGVTADDRRFLELVIRLVLQ